MGRLCIKGLRGSWGGEIKGYSWIFIWSWIFVWIVWISVYYLHIHIYFCLFMFLPIYVIVYLCIIIRNNAKLLYIYTMIWIIKEISEWQITRVDFKVDFKDSKILGMNLV